MKLLILPRYDEAGASSRVRMYQYLPALQDAGIEVAVSPLFGGNYVRALYSGRTEWVAVARGYLRRISAQLAAGAFDAVWIEKELLPWLPPVLERLRGDAAVIVDYDDAVFHRYDMHRWRLVRHLLGGRIDAVMRRADLATVGNGYLADRAKAAGCDRVETLPTVVDLTRYALHAPAAQESPLVIGWIGSPATAHYLQPLGPVIERLGERMALRAIAVGARRDQVAGTPFEAVTWSEQTEAAQVAAFDIGLMPLPDEPWERGKCGYKLIQYMACGVPVVASPVGANTEIVTPGMNGALADTSEQWLASLTELAEDPALRARQGTEGRKRVEHWYSLQAQAPRLVSMLQEAVRRRQS
jgi:glycosyltransferase involved in cell wall biosynthesis